ALRRSNANPPTVTTTTATAIAAQIFQRGDAAAAAGASFRVTCTVLGWFFAAVAGAADAPPACPGGFVIGAGRGIAGGAAGIGVGRPEAVRSPAPTGFPLQLSRSSTRSAPL